jgi:hypothetical protein
MTTNSMACTAFAKALVNNWLLIAVPIRPRGDIKLPWSSELI